MEKVQRHLLNLHNRLELPVGSINAWRPTDMNLQRLRYAQQHGDRSDNYLAFYRSLREDSRPIAEVPPPPTPSLQQLEAQLATAETRPFQKHYIPKITEQIKQLRQRQLIEPLRREAELCQSAVDSSQMFVLADALELQYLQTQRLREMLQQPGVQPDAGAAQAAELEFKKWMHLTGTVQKQFSNLRTNLVPGHAPRSPHDLREARSVPLRNRRAEESRLCP